MLQYFQGLGERIERAWRARSYDEEVFASLILDQLDATPPADHVQPEEIVDWMFSPLQEFRQPEGRDLFGEPPVMVFQGPRFFIEVLFWFSGTTDIHEHSFSGVFAVLAGSSVHSHWHFTPRRTINSRMVAGHLERTSTEILKAGDARAIRSGDRLIHQLFHLDLPSVTVVIRTYVDRHQLPQYRYLPPGLAIDPDDRDSVRRRRLVLLEQMIRGHLGGLAEHARQLIGGGDLETVFHVLSGLSSRHVDADLMRELFALARRHHGDEIVDLFAAVCTVERRTALATALRAKVADPGARFLLALLMLMPDRESIFEAIRLRYAGVEPLAMLEGWLAEMATEKALGFTFNDANRIIFRSLVEGLAADQLFERLRAAFDTPSVDGHRDRLLRHARRLARMELFRPLLSSCPLLDIDRAA